MSKNVSDKEIEKIKEENKQEEKQDEELEEEKNEKQDKELEEEKQDKELEEEKLEEEKEEEKEGEKLDEEKNEEVDEDISIKLQLGDIIKIKDPSNELLNDHTFIIDYIDEKIIKLIDINEFVNSKLKINDDGTIGDKTITSISLLFRNEKIGYASQNNLIPGTWLNIYFGGDIPTIITGEITNLEEDMIEIKTFPDKDIIYINFAYKGIPIDLPITNIEIREKPEKQKEDESLVIKNVSENLEEETQNINDDFTSTTNEVFKNNIREIILKADEIQFGEEIGMIRQQVDVNISEQRYNIESQTNDLLDELLSKIPNNQRTDRVLNNIHQMIERFKQLREEFSIFDEHRNIEGMMKKTASWKPLVNDLLHFKTMLYWLIPVVENKKNVYDVSSLNEDSEYNDLNILNTSDNLKSIQNVIKSYNETPESLNKYTTIYNELNSYFTPFSDINPELLKEIIFEKSILTNLNVIVDNLGDLKSHIVEKSEIKSRKFVIGKYNIGLKHLNATQITSSKMISHVVNLTPNDSVSLKSIVTLPEQAVRFSHISLPGTSIYDKAILNCTFLNYWQLLKESTNINNIIIDSKNIDNVDTDNLKIEETNENEKETFNEETFLNEIKHFILMKNDNSTKIPSEEEYLSFLDKIIPKTRVLFKLIKNKIGMKLTLNKVIEKLEPFLIYNNDITYKQYEEINRFLQEKISEYNKKYIEKSKAFSNIKKIGSNITNKPQANYLKQLLFNSNNVNNVLNSYSENNPTLYENVTNSELLTTFVKKDFGDIYNYAVSIENINLMLPENINSIIENQEKKINGDLDMSDEKDKCINMILAKEYNSIQDLENDNDKIIYFDKKYDNTIYSFLDNYQNEQSRMQPHDFLEFLIKKIREKMNLDENNALYYAETLINGYKQVINGDYAIIYDLMKGNNGNLVFYKRHNNQWVLDESVNETMFANSQDLLCNFQKNCIDVQEKYDSKCQSYDVNKKEMTKMVYNEILDQFDINYQLSKELLEEKLKLKFNYYSETIESLDKINHNRNFKYNNQQYKIGATTDINDNEISSATTISPYTKLRDLILGQNDFIKRQNDILQFSLKYTRSSNSNSDEDIHWLYCIKTNTKLLPCFFQTLAASFLQDNDNYSKTIEIIRKDIGVISDDGDSWVDKHSGYIICKIDLNTDEGYDEEGVRISSRELMEKDASDIVLNNIEISEKKTKSIKYENAETKMMHNIISTFSQNMNILLDEEFIIKNANDILKQILPTEEKYNETIREKAKKGSKTKPYKELYNFYILYLTIGLILIDIQTNIPGIKTKRTYPGCVKSFSGFPLDGSGDVGGLNYLACITYNLKVKIDPWLSLIGSNSDKISNNIKFFIDEYLIKISDVERKFKEKTEYLLINPIEIIPIEHNLNKWKHFLPPLIHFTMKTVENISESFKKDLLSNFKSGSHSQREKLLVIQSKIIMFSLGIQEKIQKVVDKKKLLLTNSANEPYVENACCNENGEIITIDYFFKENSDIGLYNNYVEDLSNILYDIVAITKSPFLFCRENSKNIYPTLSENYNEETIYRAFIVFCKFNSLIPTSENLIPLCGEKPLISTKESISEQIKKMKNDGYHYTNEKFLRLFQIVSRNNIINISFIQQNITRIQRIRDIINRISDDDNNDVNSKNEIGKIPLELRKDLDSLLDTFDIGVSEDTEEMRELKNYLSEKNKTYRNTIIKFLEDNGDLSSKKINEKMKELKEIMNWPKNNNYSESNISDDTTYNSILFIKENIKNILKIFPSIILNKLDYKSTQIPKYWGLSKYHNNNIQKIISDYYVNFNKFYNNNSDNSENSENSNFYTLLNNVIYNNNINKLINLVQETPYFSEINYNDFKSHSIFDERTTKLLFENYFLYSLICYIEYTDDKNLKSDENNNVSSLLLNSGDNKKLKKQIAKLIIVYLDVIFEHKNIVEYSYDDVMNLVFKSKTYEKKTITDRLENISKEARDIDTILKINKLGVWSKGLQKGLTTYVKESYDAEREYMEQFSILENKARKLGKEMDEEFMDDMDTQNYIDDEENNMNDIGEDYMDGIGDEYDPNDEY